MCGRNSYTELAIVLITWYSYVNDISNTSQGAVKTQYMDTGDMDEVIWWDKQSDPYPSVDDRARIHLYRRRMRSIKKAIKEME